LFTITKLTASFIIARFMHDVNENFLNLFYIMNCGETQTYGGLHKFCRLPGRTIPKKGIKKMPERHFMGINANLAEKSEQIYTEYLYSAKREHPKTYLGFGLFFSNGYFGTRLNVGLFI